MSRQNKQAKKSNIAKQITAMHLKGNKGASATQPKHGKIRSWSKMGRKQPNKV